MKTFIEKIQLMIAIVKAVFIHPLQDTVILPVKDGLTENEWRINKLVSKLIREYEAEDYDDFGKYALGCLRQIHKLVLPDSANGCEDCDHS